MSTYKGSEFSRLNGLDDVRDGVGELRVGLDLDEAVPEEVAEVHVSPVLDRDQLLTETVVCKNNKKLIVFFLQIFCQFFEVIIG